MGLEKPYADIPGTTIFDTDHARAGYHLNQFCMSLMRPENRQRFLADQRAHLDEWPVARGAMGDLQGGPDPVERHRLYHVPASNTAVGQPILQEA